MLRQRQNSVTLELLISSQANRRVSLKLQPLENRTLIASLDRVIKRKCAGTGSSCGSWNPCSWLILPQLVLQPRPLVGLLKRKINACQKATANGTTCKLTKKNPQQHRIVQMGGDPKNLCLINAYLVCFFWGGFAVAPFRGSVPSMHLLNSDCCAVPLPPKSFAIFALKDKYALRCQRERLELVGRNLRKVE